MVTMISRGLFIFINTIIVMIVLLIPPHSATTTSDVEEAIRNNNLDKAVEILNSTEDDNTWNTIVKNIYNSDQTNGLDSLLNLAGKFDKASKSYQLYKVLTNEVIKIDNNGYDIMKLSQSINDNIISKSLGWRIENNAQKLIDNLKERLVLINLNFLLLFINNSTTEVISGKKLLNDTFYFDQNLFEKMQIEILVKVKPNEKKEKIEFLKKLLSIENNIDWDFTWQIINILSNVDYSKKIMLLELNEAVEEFKKFELKCNDKKLSVKYRQKLRNSMPSSLFNLLFAKNICIENYELKHYLIGNNANVDKYPVHFGPYNFSAKPNPAWWKVYQDKTITRVYGPGVYICSIYDNCLHASSKKWSSEERRVYSEESSPYDTKFLWKLFIDKEYKNNVNIKNRYDEYLFASGGPYARPSSDDVGHLYTHVKYMSDCDENYCRWNFVDCS